MWSRELIDRQEVPVYRPSSGARFVVIVLADLDEATVDDQPVWSELFEQHRFGCVCPRGAESWWVDRPTSMFPDTTGEQYLRDRMALVAREMFQVPQRALALLGLGAGGAGVIRMGLKHPREFRAVAGLEAMVDFHELYGRGTTLDDMYSSREQCRQDTPILHVHPTQWPGGLFLACAPHSPWLRGNDRLHEKLSALGVPHESDFETYTCGHSWDYFNRQAPRLMRFLAQCLDRESRRLDDLSPITPSCS